jgi:hypothetical protein
MEESRTKRKHSIHRVFRRFKITRKYTRLREEIPSNLQQEIPLNPQHEIHSNPPKKISLNPQYEIPSTPQCEIPSNPQQSAPGIKIKRSSAPIATNVVIKEGYSSTQPLEDPPRKNLFRARGIGFLELPREIRNAVYSYFPIAEWTAHFESLNSFLDNIFKFCLEPSILRLNRQISAEYLDTQFGTFKLSFIMHTTSDGKKLGDRFRDIFEVLNILRYHVKDPLRCLNSGNESTNLIGSNLATLTPNGRKCGSICGNLHRIRHLNFRIAIPHPYFQQGQDTKPRPDPFDICAVLVAQVRRRTPSSVQKSNHMVFGNLTQISLRVRIMCPHGSILPLVEPETVVTLWEKAVQKWIDKLWAHSALETCEINIETIALPPPQQFLIFDSKMEATLCATPSSTGQVKSLYSFVERKVEDGEFITTEQVINDEVVRRRRFVPQTEGRSAQQDILNSAWKDLSETDHVKNEPISRDPRRHQTYHETSFPGYGFVDKLGLSLNQISKEW